MISNEEIVDSWGRENLTCSKQETLQNIKIPKSSKEFLVEIGLPKKVVGFQDWVFNLEVDNLLKPEKVQISKITQNLVNLSEFWTIGLIDSDYPVCIKENSGQVFGVYWDDRKPTEIVFVNSSVQQLSKYFTAIKKFYNRWEENKCYGDKYIKLARILKKELKAIDPKALKSEQNWWSIPLQEMCSDMI